MIYAGIGSRRTPPAVLEKMHALAFEFAQKGLLLRSGAAQGADSAFEAGCLAGQGSLELWLPWKGFNGRANGFLPEKSHFERARQVHPMFDRLSVGAQKLHARNVGQIFGEGATPVNFVMCWTADGCESHASRTVTTGGTGTAISLASEADIPIFNLANTNALSRLEKFLGEKRND